jgi:hypothetical protein
MVQDLSSFFLADLEFIGKGFYKVFCIQRQNYQLPSILSICLAKFSLISECLGTG